MATPESYQQVFGRGPTALERQEREFKERPKGGLFTRSMDAWSVGDAWLDQLAVNDDKVLTLEAQSVDLELYDSLLDDDIAMSAFQQRRLNVVKEDWVVEPGADDARSVAAADHLRDQLRTINWDDICDKMLYGRWYGYAVGEVMWEIGQDGLLRMKDIVVPNRRWFAYSNAGELRLRTNEDPDGEPVPAMKFWQYRCGGSHDFVHYGVGLAHWCYWPIFFKKNVLKFWAVFLEKFGMPTMLGLFDASMEGDEEALGKLLLALQAIGRDSAVIAPEGADIKAMEGTRSGSGASSYEQFITKMDTALTRIILSQTMTSEAGPAGLGSGQAEVHNDVADALAQSDSDMLHEGFNTGPATWLTGWNFPGAIPPRVYRKIEDEEDLDVLAERDGKLHALGWERTDQSMEETYGPGYQRKKVEVPPAFGGNLNPQQPRLPVPDFAARDPRTLYINRPVINASEILSWAKAQGFTNLVDPSDLHVTVVLSRTPVRWFDIGERGIWGDGKVEIPPGGPRAVEELGDEGAVVLHFASGELEYRHREMIELGASHDFSEYQPHITLSYDAADVNLDEVEPYNGRILLGPEKWEELDEDWQPRTVQFDAVDPDAIDRLVEALSVDGSAAVASMVAPIREAVAGMDADTDPETVRVALLEALERMDTDALANALADPLVAVRAAEQSGEGVEGVA